MKKERMAGCSGQPADTAREASAGMERREDMRVHPIRQGTDSLWGSGESHQYYILACGRTGSNISKYTHFRTFHFIQDKIRIKSDA